MVEIKLNWAIQASVIDLPDYQFENPCPPNLREVTLQCTGTGLVQLVLDWWYRPLWTSGSDTEHCEKVVLADLAKVDDIHWKMLTAARVETPEEEAVFSLMVCHYADDADDADAADDDDANVIY